MFWSLKLEYQFPDDLRYIKHLNSTVEQNYDIFLTSTLKLKKERCQKCFFFLEKHTDLQQAVTICINVYLQNVNSKI